MERRFRVLNELIRREGKRGVLAIGYFSRIPIVMLDSNADDYQKSTRYLPLVGLVIAGLMIGVFQALYLVLPLQMSVLLTLIFSVTITGGLHEDGLADFSDGFFGPFSRQRTLAIMKDSRIGVFGVLSLVSIFALRYQSLAQIPVELLWGAFLAGETLSRGLVLPYLQALPYARSENTYAKSMSGGFLGWLEVLAGLSVGLVPLWVLVPDHRFFWFIFGHGLVGLFLGFWWKRRIGGYTGDCLGAAQQLQLVTFLLIYLAVAC